MKKILKCSGENCLKRVTCLAFRAKTSGESVLMGQKRGYGTSICEHYQSISGHKGDLIPWRKNEIKE